jgi:hypothetical protein
LPHDAGDAHLPGAQQAGHDDRRRLYGETFAEADSVLLDIDELFPNGSIVLHGIKTFAQGRIDEAILDAASVICSTRSTLSGIFINVVQGDRNLLNRWTASSMRTEWASPHG